MKSAQPAVPIHPQFVQPVNRTSNSIHQQTSVSVKLLSNLIHKLVLASANLPTLSMKANVSSVLQNVQNAVLPMSVRLVQVQLRDPI